ncbi:MAG: carbohydrate ABC transporter permease, partial [Tetrasphaera sp.]
MRSQRSPIATAITYIVVTISALIVMAPLIWMMLGSLKTDHELRQVPPTFLPESVTFANFTTLFSKLSFSTYFVNSTIVAVIVTVANLVFCSMLGYALAMLDFRGKKLVFGLVMATLMIPGVVTFIPLFVLVANLGLLNTLPGLFLPFLAAPFGVFLMRQFMSSLPRELLDAGRVDGAGELKIFFRIFLPLAGPAMATLGIITFLGSWNNFLWPLVVAQRNDAYTLPVALALYSSD